MTNPNYEMLKRVVKRWDEMPPDCEGYTRFKPARDWFTALADELATSKGKQNIDVDQLRAIANAEEDPRNSLPLGDRAGYEALRYSEFEASDPGYAFGIYTKAYGDKGWCDRVRHHWNAIAAAAIAEHERQKGNV